MFFLSDCAHTHNFYRTEAQQQLNGTERTRDIKFYDLWLILLSASVNLINFICSPKGYSTSTKLPLSPCHYIPANSFRVITFHYGLSLPSPALLLPHPPPPPPSESCFCRYRGERGRKLTEKNREQVFPISRDCCLTTEGRWGWKTAGKVDLFLYICFDCEMLLALAMRMPRPRENWRGYINPVLYFSYKGWTSSLR